MTDDTTPCVTLGLTLLVGPVDGYPVALRVARGLTDLVLTEKEDREAETVARKKAEARVAELEKELARARAARPPGAPRRR